MKKTVALCLLFLVFLTGCSAKKAEIEFEGFSCDVEARFGDDSYYLFLEVPGGEIIKARVTEGQMKGLTITLDGEEIKLEYLGMEYKLPDGFSEKNCVSVIKEVLRSIKRNGDGAPVNSNNTFTLDTDYGPAKITLRPDGFPTNILLIDEDAEIKLSNFSYIN